MTSRRVFSRRQSLESSAAAAAGAASFSLVRGPSASAATIAAQGATPAAAVVMGGTFNYAEAGDFEDFNPWGFLAVNFGTSNQVFSRLTWTDPNGEIHRDLAESYQLSTDGLSLTLKLRQGVKWHDGTDLSAADFVARYGYLQEPALAEYSGTDKIKGLFAPISDVRAVDSFTLELVFSTPVAYVMDLLDYWFAIRIDDTADPEFLTKLPIGTGPFTMAQWEPSQFVRLPKFADFYRTDVPYIDEMMFSKLERAETLVPNLESGTISGILLTSPADVAPLQENADYTVEIISAAGSIFNIIVNVKKPPFDQKEVRQALAYSLNRVGMAETAYFGVSAPITSPFASPSSLAYREDLVMAHPFDLARAASMLEAAGVSDLRMTINVTPVWPQMKLCSLIWQADLQTIGVTLTVNEVEAAQFYDIGGAPDLLSNDIHPWVVGRTGRDPAVFFATQTIYRGGPENRFGYVNEELEALVAQWATEVDPEARRAIYQQLNELVIDSSHIIQIATDPRVWVFANNVTGAHYDLNGNLFVDTVQVGET